MKKSIFLIALIFGGAANAQDQSSFTLSEAEEYAVNNSIKMKNVALDYDIAEKKIWETTAIGLPQVSASGQFQHFIEIPTSVVDAQLFNPMAPAGEILEFQMGQEFSTGMTFNVNQLLFDGSYIVGLKFAKFYKNTVKTDIELTQQEVKVMCREAYYNVLVAQRNIELMDSIVMATKQILDQTQVYADNGLLPDEEIDQLTLALNRVELAKMNGERQLEVAKNLLKLSMGYNLEKDIEVQGTLDDLMAEIIKDAVGAGDQSIQNNSNYIKLDQKREIDEYQLRMEKMTYLPSAGAFFTHSQNAFRNEFNFFANEQWYPTSIWGLQLNVPITSSGMKMSKVKQAKIVIEQDNNALSDLERSLEFQALQLNSSMTTALSEVDLEKQNVDLASKIYENSMKREEIGSVSALTVTQLQSQLLTAEGNYISALMKVLQVKIEQDKLYNQ